MVSAMMVRDGALTDAGKPESHTLNTVTTELYLQRMTPSLGGLNAPCAVSPPIRTSRVGGGGVLSRLPIYLESTSGGGRGHMIRS